jgi:hypothetical protein
MTTDKKHVSVYLTSTKEIDDLVEALRRLAPLEARGRISRSTAIEAAVRLALADVRGRGRDAALYRAMVVLPSSDTEVE